MHAIRTSWDKIIRWFDANPPAVPDDALELYNGATAKEIKEAEQAMGISFPEDVKESYRLHNGNRECQGLFTWGGGLISLKRMVKAWRMWAKGVASGTFQGMEDLLQSKGPIKKCWWNVRWIPIIDRGGSCDFVDMDPAEGGHVGQIVHFFHETGADRVDAPSWQAYLSDFADGLEKGKLCYDDEWVVLPVEAKKARRRTRRCT
jgi:cell wall assembly regulator SMI1